MADQWVITADERMKHDLQFSQLKPIDGFITGEQAKSVFVKSNLPPQVLYQIWALSDINGDGKMDKKEFSIAIHLIQKKLQGRELPTVLPASLKADPVNAHMGGLMGNQPNSAWGAPAMSMPINRPAGPTPIPVAMGTTMPASFGGGASNQWVLSQPQKLKYIQVFNQNDRTKKGFLTGMEARTILTQTGLPQNLLANVWNLADVDKDGKLTTDEFCLALFFVDVVKAGQQLPLQLPPELMPPAFRAGAVVSPPTVAAVPMGIPIQGGGVGGFPANMGMTMGMPQLQAQSHFPPPQAAVTTATTAAPTMPGQMKSDAFADFGLGGGGFAPASMPEVKQEPEVPLSPLKPVTFEDKRKENFDKGNAELERRRALLKEQQKQEEEARMAKEREEQEKQERIRLEKERKKQLEYEQQMEKIRQQEMEKEEQRRKAAEQRETARREMERQRQLEAERQQKQQLAADKLREQKLLEQAAAALGEAKLERETVENKKAEMLARIEQARRSVRDLTDSIEQMRVTRDSMLADIDRSQNELQTRTDKLNTQHQERMVLDRKAQQQTINADDSYKAVVHSHSSKQANIQKLRAQLAQFEKDTATKLTAIDAANAEAEEARRKRADVEAELNRLRDEVNQKARDWEAMMNKENRNKAASNLSKDSKAGSKKYRALYAFEARNADELTLNEGDVVWVGPDQAGVEADWLLGESTRGRGLFPEAYVELAMDDVVAETLDANCSQNITEQVDEEVVEAFRDEYGGTSPSNNAMFPDAGGFGASFDSAPQSHAVPASSGIRAQALFPWVGKKDNHLSFEKGDIIMVLEQQDVWWRGELNGKVGLFPKSYVKELAAGMVKSDSANQIQAQYADSAQHAGVAPSVACPLPSAVALPEPEAYVAQFPYMSGETSDLTFGAGDTVMVTHKDEEWWYGYTTDNKRGIFPANYVVKKAVEISPSQTAAKPTAMAPAAAAGKKLEVAIVIAPYQATGPEQLSLQPNQLIQVRKKSPSGWWEGELQARGQKRKIGWFPANYVKIHNPRATPDSTQSSALAPPSGGGFDGGSRGNSPVSYPAPATAPAVMQVSALYKYDAQNADELSFEKDAIINVLDRDDPDWWRGETGGHVGLFPSNYVQQIDQPAI